TPLQLCTIHGQLYLMQVLLNSGVAVDEEIGATKRRALHLAIENSQIEAAKLLISIRAATDSLSSTYNTPLQLAIETGNLEAVQLLISNGADVNALFNPGESPLSLAISNGWMDVVTLLINAGASIDHRLENGESLAHIAAESGVVSLLKVVLPKDEIITDDTGLTLLHTAACHGKVECSRYLLDRGYSAIDMDKYGRTPIHKAIEQRHSEVVTIL
ncbi:ankyrin repeat-containing domain protein, partial [Trichophaea hybrida]